jgi:hypothetical protein
MKKTEIKKQKNDNKRRNFSECSTLPVIAVAICNSDGEIGFDVRKNKHVKQKLKRFKFSNKEDYADKICREIEEPLVERDFEG